jgi:hypothetical protein
MVLHYRGQPVAVFQLVKTDNSAQVAIFEYMAALARNGKLRGTAICFTDDEGVEQAVFTGLYRAHPDKAAGAALRMSMQLAQMRGEYDHP